MEKPAFLEQVLRIWGPLAPVVGAVVVGFVVGLLAERRLPVRDADFADRFRPMFPVLGLGLGAWWLAPAAGFPLPVLLVVGVGFPVGILAWCWARWGKLARLRESGRPVTGKVSGHGRGFQRHRWHQRWVAYEYAFQGVEGSGRDYYRNGDLEPRLGEPVELVVNPQEPGEAVLAVSLKPR